VIEVAVNGGFLDKVEPAGPLGGAVDASPSRAEHPCQFPLWIGDWSGKRAKFLSQDAGLIGLAGYLAFAGGLNLVLSHLREITAECVRRYGQEVLAQMIHAPLVLNDVMSWAFFCMASSFSLVAMYDGLVFTDPYPGYAGVEKRWIEANRKYRAGKSELVDRLSDFIRDGAIEAMNGAARDLSCAAASSTAS